MSRDDSKKDNALGTISPSGSVEIPTNRILDSNSPDKKINFEMPEATKPVSRQGRQQERARISQDPYLSKTDDRGGTAMNVSSSAAALSDRRRT